MKNRIGVVLILLLFVSLELFTQQNSTMNHKEVDLGLTKKSLVLSQCSVKNNLFVLISEGKKKKKKFFLRKYDEQMKLSKQQELFFDNKTDKYFLLKGFNNQLHIFSANIKNSTVTYFVESIEENSFKPLFPKKKLASQPFKSWNPGMFPFITYQKNRIGLVYDIQAFLDYPMIQSLKLYTFKVEVYDNKFLKQWGSSYNIDLKKFKYGSKISAFRLNAEADLFFLSTLFNKSGDVNFYLNSISKDGKNNNIKIDFNDTISSINLYLDSNDFVRVFGFHSSLENKGGFNLTYSQKQLELLNKSVLIISDSNEIKDINTKLWNKNYYIVKVSIEDNADILLYGEKRFTEFHLSYDPFTKIFFNYSDNLKGNIIVLMKINLKGEIIESKFIHK